MFNRITVNPQLPKRINRLTEIANNLWWSWNTEVLKLFKEIDIDLWEKVDKNPVKFLKLISQENTVQKRASFELFLEETLKKVDFINVRLAEI